MIGNKWNRKSARNFYKVLHQKNLCEKGERVGIPIPNFQNQSIYTNWLFILFWWVELYQCSFQRKNGCSQTEAEKFFKNSFFYLNLFLKNKKKPKFELFTLAQGTHWKYELLEEILFSHLLMAAPLIVEANEENDLIRMECRSDASLVLFKNAKFARTAQTVGKFSERWRRWRSILHCSCRQLRVVFAWRRLALTIGKFFQVITELKIFIRKINSHFQFWCRNAKNFYFLRLREGRQWGRVKHEFWGPAISGRRWVRPSQKFFEIF